MRRLNSIFFVLDCSGSPTGYAYRILGRVFDAEDLVQDVWVRWQGTGRARVRDRVAFLGTVTTRVSLNDLTSPHARREVSVAGRLSKCDCASADPAIEAERGEPLEFTVQQGRAVYVLRKAFDSPFRDIAETLDLSESNARQLTPSAQASHRTTHNPVEPANPPYRATTGATLTENARRKCPMNEARGRR